MSDKPRLAWLDGPPTETGWYWVAYRDRMLPEPCRLSRATVTGGLYFESGSRLGCPGPGYRFAGPLPEAPPLLKGGTS